MRQVRQGVFETNSSSTHSLCITKNNLLDSLESRVDFRLKDYGWEESIYKDTRNKANYLYTALCNNGEHELILIISDTLKKHKIECTFEDPDDSKYGGCKAYIDHNDCLSGELTELCKDENMLLRFLFSSESFIITGNDNSDSDISIDVDYDHDEIYKGN